MNETTDTTEPAAAAPPPLPTPQPKLAIWYKYDQPAANDATQIVTREARIILSNLFDIRTESDLNGVEAWLKQHVGVQVILITNWKRLDG